MKNGGTKRVFRSAGILDIPELGRLQTEGVLLDPKRHLTSPESPVSVMLRAPLAFYHPPSHTYVAQAEKERGAAGFIQMQCRPQTPHYADVTFIAPAWNGTDEEGQLWTQLLQNACRSARRRGVEKVFASLPSESEMAIPFLNAGFCIFAQEEILVHPHPAPPAEGLSNPLRPELAEDTWAIQRIHAAQMPVSVKLTEGILCGENGNGISLNGRHPLGEEGYVLEDAGGVVGHVQIFRGRRGHWLEIALHPDAQELALKLVDGALALLRDLPARPVYCPVRTYQNYLKPALLARGFTPFDRRDIAAYATLARVTAPALGRPTPVEGRAEAPIAPTLLPHFSEKHYSRRPERSP